MQQNPKEKYFDFKRGRTHRDCTKGAHRQEVVDDKAWFLRHVSGGGMSTTKGGGDMMVCTKPKGQPGSKMPNHITEVIGPDQANTQNASWRSAVA